MHVEYISTATTLHYHNIGFWHGKASQNKILRPEGEEFFLLARHKVIKS